MLFIHRQETDPYFNIAAEEYLLKNIKEDVFSVYINDACIVVGKHQNALKEVNYWYVKEKNIPVIRRISGGGTVYQDEGNLNFSFIVSGEKGRLVDYRRATQPVIDFLQTLGIASEFEGKSNLVIDGSKISGNSAHVYRDKVIHHGTILFSSDLDALEQALSPGNIRYDDKSVQSAHKNVTNVSRHLDKSMTIQDFSVAFFHFVMNNTANAYIYELSEDDRRKIQSLSGEKYRKWEWNFGYSPDYIFNSGIKLKHQNFEISLKVSKGIIKEARFQDTSGNRLPPIESMLTGIPHMEEAVHEKLNNFNFADDFGDDFAEKFIHHLF